MNDETVVENTDSIESTAAPAAPCDSRTLEMLLAEQNEMNQANYGFGFAFGDKSVFYTGRAGKGFLNVNPNETFLGYSKEGALRKALSMVEKYADSLLAPMTGVVLVKA